MAKSQAGSFTKLQRDLAKYFRTLNPATIPKGIPKDRIQVYQELIHSGISSFIHNQFPISEKLTSKRKWDTLIKTFIATHPIASPYFHQITSEFILFLNQQKKIPLPPYLLEIAHYEWLELAIIMAEDQPTPKHIKTIHLAKPLRTTPILQVCTYHYPVHLYTEKTSKPKQAQQPIFLLIYRTLKDELKTHETSQILAVFINNLINHPRRTLSTHTKNLIKTLSLPPEQHRSFTKQLHTELKILVKKQVLLGSSGSSVKLP